MNTLGLTGKKPSRLIVHAINIHQGGGQSLLSSIIETLPCSGLVVLLLDSRLPLPSGIPCNTEIQSISPTIMQRLTAEKWLAEHTRTEDIVLCFGNLPPLFKLRGHTLVFVQNRYLVDDIQLLGFPLKVRLRLAVERFWFSRRKSNADEFIVQTATMKRLLGTVTEGKAPIHVLPFVAEPKGYTRTVQQSNKPKECDCDFLYVASGEPHKNHCRLIEAWCLLAADGVFPSLCLTLDEARFHELHEKISSLEKKHRLRIINAGEVSHSEALKLYKKAGAFIYPSTFESFGLPLIEARQAGLPVLASELDYVRDVLDPEQTFDPESSASIARAVKRFLGTIERPLPLLNAGDFLKIIWEHGRSNDTTQY